GEFDAPLVATVAQQPEELIDESIAIAIDVGLVERAGGELGFRHALIREAVIEATLPHETATLHRRAADALAARSADANLLERRARHLELAGVGVEASDLLVAAAETHFRAHALSSTEAAGRRAQILATTPAVAERAADIVAQALALQGRWVQAIE